MPKPVLGLLVGLLLGALEALQAFYNVSLHPIAGSLLMGGLLKGAMTGAIAGLVARRTRAFSPTLLAGVGAGVLLTLLAWLASHDTGRPHILPAIAIGGVAALISLRWGH